LTHPSFIGGANGTESIKERVSSIITIWSRECRALMAQQECQDGDER
jgi:hypothetical protein